MAALLGLTSPAWSHANEEYTLLADDALPGDRLGAAVEVSGDSILAGAPGRAAGAAYVFHYDGTSFVQQAKLLPTAGAAGDRFGAAVALDGDTAVVGAPGADGGAANAGALFVFVRSGTTWSLQAELRAAVPIAGESFGSALALEGDRLVVGAPSPAEGSAEAGRALVFTRSGSTWTEAAELRAAAGSPGDRFGSAVDLRDDQAVAGAPGTAPAGALHVFREQAGLWSEAQTLAPILGAAGDAFGAACALSNVGVLAVGAPGDDETAPGAGANYEYVEQAGSWVPTIKQPGLGSGEALGAALASHYGFTLSGSTGHPAGGVSGAGAAVLFRVGQASVAQVYVASDPESGRGLGGAVSMDDCWLVAGAAGDDQAGAEAGALFVFELVSGTTWLVNGNEINPAVMNTLQGPNIGKLWRIEVDTSAFPAADQTDVLIYTQFLGTPVATPWGELLVGGRRLFWSTLAGTGKVVHEHVLPLDYSLAGRIAPTQGMLRGPAGVVTLTNAEHMLIGCFGQ